MSPVRSALLAALAAKLALAAGGLLSSAALVEARPLLPGTALLLAVVSIPMLVTAVMSGWVFARFLPSAPLRGVGVGLAVGAASPLLGLLSGASLKHVLLACAAQALQALCFAVPSAVASRALATGMDRLIYAMVAVMLFPLTAWTIIDTFTMARIAPPAARYELSTSVPVFVPVAMNLPRPAAASGAAVAGAAAAGPSFETALVQALREGRFAPDPKLQALRGAAVSAGNTLVEAPCDAAARSRLRAAVLDYIAERPELERPGIELFTVAGETRRVGPILDAPAARVAYDAFTAGIIGDGNLSERQRAAWKAQGGPPAPDMASPLRCRWWRMRPLPPGIPRTAGLMTAGAGSAHAVVRAADGPTMRILRRSQVRCRTGQTVEFARQSVYLFIAA